MKKLFLGLGLLLSFLLSATSSHAALKNGVYINDARTLFLRNQAIILAVNIRTFNAQDKNKNDIIEPEKGEVSGNFLNAINRLDTLRKQGINTIHLLPVTPVGKVKAMGTAGSLYAISDFTKLNPQLDDETNELSVFEEAKLFVKECHKRNIRVIFDLPSCGSYDMYLSNPNLFLKDASGKSVVPADWTDVRLFKVQNPDGSLNDEVYLLYRNYVDMVQKLGADGIRADVATSKPYEFWQNLISYARQKDDEFLFLAEASESWTEPVSKLAPFTPYYKLLDAGFDGWYGSFSSFKDWNTPEKFEKEISLLQNIRKEYAAKSQPKAVIGNFATHDDPSPINIGGMPFSQMIIWLQATLPVNSYFVDGFQTGDAYQYKYANQKAPKSKTDDDYYYVHKGKFDIFNFSRKPGAKNEELLSDFVLGNKMKAMSFEILAKGTFEMVKTDNPDVFGYTYSYNYAKIFVIFNKDLVYQNTAKFVLKDFDMQNDMVMPLKVSNGPKFDKKHASINLAPGEINVMFIQKGADDSNNKKKK